MPHRGLYFRLAGEKSRVPEIGTLRLIKPFHNAMPRDYRIDFFRGLALISIFVNHIPGNFYSNFTHRNFGLSDAAELFVLLASRPLSPIFRASSPARRTSRSA